MTTELARRDPGALAVMPAEMSIEELVARTRKVQEAMKAVMHEGEHYGVIPGTGSKPTLLKPGAEKLLNLFMLDPEYDAPAQMEGDHLTIVSRCTLYHIPTGTRVGSGMGMCSTREAKYAYREAKRVCPSCGKDAIIKGRAEYGGGWLCFAKRGGCGAKYKDGDGTIETQATGRVDNPDKPDQYNTVLKMANKRSLVAAVLNVTGASDIFTQDLEDLPETTSSQRTSPAGPSPAPAETPEEVAAREFYNKARQDPRVQVLQRETPEQEAARLFPDEPEAPIVAPEHGDDVLLAKALGLLDSRVRAEAVRKKMWDASCAPTPYRAMPPRERLLALLGSLGAQ